MVCLSNSVQSFSWYFNWAILTISFPFKIAKTVTFSSQLQWIYTHYEWIKRQVFTNGMRKQAEAAVPPQHVQNSLSVSLLPTNWSRNLGNRFLWVLRRRCYPRHAEACAQALCKRLESKYLSNDDSAIKIFHVHIYIHHQKSLCNLTVKRFHMSNMFDMPLTFQI